MLCLLLRDCITEKIMDILYMVTKRVNETTHLQVKCAEIFIRNSSSPWKRLREPLKCQNYGFFLLDGEWGPAEMGNSRLLGAGISLGRLRKWAADSRVSVQQGNQYSVKL